MKNFTSWLARANILLYSVSLWVITIVIKGLVHLFFYVANIPDTQFRERVVNENVGITLNNVMDALLIAPILETLIFQTSFFYLFKWLKINKWIFIIASAAVFGAYHSFSTYYIVDASIVGAIFMYTYILRAKADNQPFLSTVAAHFFINLIAIIIMLVIH